MQLRLRVALSLVFALCIALLYFVDFGRFRSFETTWLVRRAAPCSSWWQTRRALSCGWPAYPIIPGMGCRACSPAPPTMALLSSRAAQCSGPIAVHCQESL